MTTGDSQKPLAEASGMTTGDPQKPLAEASGMTLAITSRAHFIHQGIRVIRAIEPTRQG